MATQKIAKRKYSPYAIEQMFMKTRRKQQDGETLPLLYELRINRIKPLLAEWEKRRPVPVGDDFDDFVWEMMATEGDYTAGFDEYAEMLATEIKFRYGFDPRHSIIDENAPMYPQRQYPLAAEVHNKHKTVQAGSAYNTLDYESESPYGKVDEHPRNCPEHPGVQLRRIPTEREGGLTPEDAKGGDGIYQCPIDGETYSYTKGHGVEFTGSAASQIPDGLSKSRESSQGATSNTAPYEQAKPGAEEVKPSEDSWNERRKRIRPFLSADKDSESPAKKGENKTKKSALQKKADLFGPVQKMTRYCPDHEGISLARITDKTYQCSLDGRIYDFERGFETDDGHKHKGGSVAQMTPDSPGYYQSPHPPHLFPGVVKDAHVGDLITRRAQITKQRLDGRGAEFRFCHDIDAALQGDGAAVTRVQEIISTVLKGSNTPLVNLALEVYNRLDAGSTDVETPDTEEQEAEQISVI